MRKIILASISILIFCLCSLAQNNEISPCPTITVNGPSGLVTPGDDVIFTADVDSSQKLEYKWTVSNGEISSGQNSPVITVSTTQDMNGTNLTATVEIKGLPENCAKRASETAVIKQVGGHPIKLYTHEKSLFENFKATVTGVASELKKNPDSVAIFIAYYSPKSNIQILKKRILEIEEFLIEDQQMTSNRFSFVFVKDEDQYTNIFLVPTNSDLEKLNWKEALEKLGNDN